MLMIIVDWQDQYLKQLTLTCVICSNNELVQCLLLTEYVGVRYEKAVGRRGERKEGRQTAIEELPRRRVGEGQGAGYCLSALN